MASEAHDDLLLAYQRELSYLRAMGAEFAAKYPKIASRLELAEDGSADPHVERLIESFAFLTARLQHQMDAEYPQFTMALLGVLYPHLIEPVPAMSVAQLQADPDGTPPSGFEIPRHASLFADTETGQTARFRTCYPVTLWPVEVREARLETTDRHPFLDGHPQVTAVLRLRLECMQDTFKQLELQHLRFHLNGERQVVFPLYDLLFGQVYGVALQAPQKPGQGDGDRRPAPQVMPPSAIRPVGLRPEEEVLPTPNHAHPGYRLLQEYFTFPEKFLFFDLDLQGAQRIGGKLLDVLILLTEPPRRRLSFSAETFALGCTPVVNLFSQTSDPIRLDHRKSEYQLVVDKRQEAIIEVHTINSVSASSDPQWPETIAPFFSFNHPAAGEHHTAFYHARRQPTGRREIPGTDVYLSFLDLNLQPTSPATQTVYAHCLCTNRDLAAQMPAGAAMQIELTAPITGITCLRKPTPRQDPPLGGKGLWRLVSQLSLNHLSLASGPESLNALRELLRLYGAAGQANLEGQLSGLMQLDCRPCVVHIGDEAWRGFCQGLELSLTFDEGFYVGQSALLFSAVLSTFFSLYAAVNTFTQVLVKSKQRQGVWKRWPPLAGAQPVL